MTPEESV